MTTLYLDLETHCSIPIRQGVHRYSEAVEILLFAWAIEDGPVSVVEEGRGEKRPAELREALEDEEILVCAHNSGFDRTVLRYTGTEIAIPRWRDTMIKAYSHSLPGALSELCEILGIDADKAKDKAGKQLVQLFCKPRPKNSIITRATHLTHPVEWKKFVSYAGSDIHAMREVDKRLPAWNFKGDELALWHLDQQINDRGVLVDLDLAHAAVRAVDITQKQLAHRTKEITDNEVGSAMQRDALLKFMLAEYGVSLPDLQMATLERRMEDPELPPAMRELLGIRLQASTSSTTKYRTLINSTNADSRLRGILQFNGAARTGRWAGRLFQPQNLPRPTMQDEEIEAGIEALKVDAADLIFPDIMRLTSSAIRGCIIAPPGRKLVISDLSNIEGRDQAWLANESWKLQAFREYDAGLGPDLYKMAYAKSFGISPDQVTKDQRQVGKVQELALGYQGGVGAFITFASAYSIDLEDMAANAWDAIPHAMREEAAGMLSWTKKQKRPTFGLSDEAFIVCESFKRGWRNGHPHIVALWGALEETVKAAIPRPGHTLTVGRLKVRRDGSWLRIAMPSGRALCYPAPALDDSGAITYMGKNQYTRKWSRIKTYGGKLFENLAQAVARDVMAHNMPLIEQAGYHIVLTVHDEVITEAPDSPEFNHEHLATLLANNPPWAPDMPLAAAGFETYRYKKD